MLSDITVRSQCCLKCWKVPQNLDCSSLGWRQRLQSSDLKRRWGTSKIKCGLLLWYLVWGMLCILSPRWEAWLQTVLPIWFIHSSSKPAGTAANMVACANLRHLCSLCVLQMSRILWWRGALPKPLTCRSNGHSIVRLFKSSTTAKEKLLDMQQELARPQNLKKISVGHYHFSINMS